MTMVHFDSRKCLKHGDFDGHTRKYFFQDLFECPVCAAEKRVKELLNQAFIPPRYKHTSIENFTASGRDQIKVKSLTGKYLESALAGNPGNLILLGSIGTGKTHLACALASAFCRAFKPARYTTVRNVIRAVRDTWRRDSEHSEGDVINAIVDYDLLVLDEVGVQAGTDNERDILLDVIDGRYRDNAPTVIVSNLNLDGIKGALGERAVDRLRDGGSLATFNWQSHRQSNLD